MRNQYRALSICVAMALWGQTLAQQPTPTATSLICDQEPSCGHFYNDGKLFKSITSADALVSISLNDTGKYMRMDVAITALSSTPIDVLPQTFTLKITSPDEKILAYVPPEKMIASASHHATFANIMQGAAAGMAQNQTSTTSTTNGNVNVNGSDGSSANGTYSGTSTSTTSTPDYAAQARANQRIAERRASLANASQDLLASSFLASTLTNGQTKVGRVYFERAKHHKEVSLTMLIGTTTYVFPFSFEK